MAILRDAGIDTDELRARLERRVAQGSPVLGDADAAALWEIGIDLDAVRAKIEATFGAGSLRSPVDPPGRGSWRGRRGDAVRAAA